MEMWSVVFVAIALLVIYITHWVYRWNNPKCNGKLPPGSMGFPVIGETLKFLSPNSSFDLLPFVKKRMERYGPLFKTNLVGTPTVISTDPEINNFIFQQEGKSFQSWYMDSFTELFGRTTNLAAHTIVHKYLRSLVLSLFGPENLKENLLPEIEQTTRTYFQLWSTQPSIELKEGISTMIFDLTAKKMISYDEVKSGQKLRGNFVDFIKGLISFPLNIPGTIHYKCLQGRKKAMKLLKDMLVERRAKASPEKGHGDFMDLIMEELKKEETILTEGFALDLMFVLLFASFETTSSALTLAFKILADYPLVVEELTREHESILRSRENLDSTITWTEYKSMTFTSMVISEIVRLANIVPGVFRKTIKEVEINGYTIPAGWAVMVCPPAVHLNPAKYEDPLVFNPWRWEVSVCKFFVQLGMETSAGSKNFIAFGGGPRYCTGADFAKLQMTVFFHCLVTKYRWMIVKGGDIVRRPGLIFPNGIHIQLTDKEANESK
ncbi:hypothetical protein GIB67_006740, partial [Kingdonia uniflora]